MMQESPAKTDTSALDQASETNEQVVRRLFERIFNSGKLELLDEVVAEEYVGPRGERGPGAFRAVISRLKTGFPDLAYTLDDVVAEGDRVAVRWHWRGTNTGIWNGYPPTHKPLENSGMGLFELRSGKIVRATLETDRLGFLQQLGVVSPLVGRPGPDESK